MLFTITGYDAANAWTKTTTDVDELIACKSSSGITWINVENFEDSFVDSTEEQDNSSPSESASPSFNINRLAEVFGIHSLTVEDILDNTHQRPKVEEFEDYLFIVFKAVDFSDDMNFEHIGLIIKKDTVLTFQNRSNSYFEKIKKRILNNAGRHRRMGADYLAYTIIDAAIDEYYTSIDLLGSEIGSFEDRAVDERDDNFIQDIQKFKRKLLKMRQVVSPLRESISTLMRLESDLVSDEIDPFLKDLYDHTIQTTETVETYRELLAGIMEVNMTAASNRISKVMKVLTIISTIFIPITFIVGVYGMNFPNMPELKYDFGYFVCWGVMLTIVLGMLLFFKRRRWF